MSSSAALPPHLDPRGRHRGADRPVARIAARVVGALLSAGLLVGSGYAWQSYRQISTSVARLPIQVNQQAPRGHRTDFNAADENLLLVGNDDRTNMTRAESRQLHAAQDGGSFNTDTMMIVHVPADGSKATLISLPRDSYVHIKGFGRARLNSAYPDGYGAAPASASLAQQRAAGANLLMATITNLTGVTITHYLQVDLLGFYRISQAIGGVPVNLCHAVDDSRSANRAAGQPGGSGFKASAGRHVLKGVRALEFVRQRHFLPLGDLDRVRRQQYFLASAFRQVASVGILTKFRALGNAVDRSISTDPGLDLIDLAQQLESLSANEITGTTIPTSPERINGMDVLRVSPRAVRAKMERVLNPSAVKSSGSESHRHHHRSAPSPVDRHCVD